MSIEYGTAGIVGGGGLKVSSRVPMPAEILSGTSGNIFIITPSATQYVSITSLGTGNLSNVELGLTLTAGGRVLASGAELHSTPVSGDSLSVGSGASPDSILGGKGEAFVLSKDAGSTVHDIGYNYLLLEDI